MIKQMKKKDRSIIFGFYRPISIFLCRLLIKTKITGNQISVFLMFFSIFCFVLIAINKIILGTLLLQVALLLDCMDGAMARMRKQESLKGVYFECMWHECILPLFYLSLGIYTWKVFNNPIYIMLGSLTAISILIINLLHHRYRMIVSDSGEGEKRTKMTVYERILEIFTCPSYAFTYALILVLAGLLQYMILPYFILYALLVMHKFKKFVLCPG